MLIIFTKIKMEGVHEGDGTVLTDATDFIQNMSRFFNTEDLSDVVIKIGEEKYFAHKFVLAKSSSVFRTMLYEKPWSQSVSNEVVLNESPECIAAFRHFLRYLYTAGIALNVGNSVGILCLADKYNVQSLKDLCIVYMLEHSCSPYVANALNWYSWSKALNLDSIQTNCTQTITWNIEDVIKSPEWLLLDIEFIEDILRCDKLVVSDEFYIFDGVQQWLLEESKYGQLTSYAQRLLPLVRFPQMLVPQLYQVEQSELANNACCHNILHQLLGKAYRFRSLAATVHPADFNEPYYKPRNYLDLVVDQVSMQNTLRFGIQCDVKTFAGPVPSERREAEWKITYRRNNGSWMMQIYFNDTSIRGEPSEQSNCQVSLVIFNGDKKVIQVLHGDICEVPTRTSPHTVQVDIKDPENSKVMYVLIKPTVAKTETQLVTHGMAAMGSTEDV